MALLTTVRAYAKLNLGLVVGSMRPDGKHEVATIIQRIALHDDLTLEPREALVVEGFAGDTIVRAALEALALAVQTEAAWGVRIVKRIPVAAGLGGGSSDAAAALRLANATLGSPLPEHELRAIAAAVGADVPFFLRPEPQLATGDGTTLRPLPLPRDYAILLVVPADTVKSSTRSVYEAFDARHGEKGFAVRAARLAAAAESIRRAEDLARLPANDLVASPLTDELRALGAFRADVSGAGPTVYGLFADHDAATRAEEALRERGRTFLTRPV